MERKIGHQKWVFPLYIVIDMYNGLFVQCVQWAIELQNEHLPYLE